MTSEQKAEIAKNSYETGQREYDRLCGEKITGFTTYMSIVAAIYALQCAEFINAYGTIAFAILVLILSIVFGRMTKRTERFIQHAREKLVYYELNGLDNTWYREERLFRASSKCKASELFFNKINKQEESVEPKDRKKSLFAGIIMVYVLMTIISFAIAAVRMIMHFTPALNGASAETAMVVIKSIAEKMI